MMTPTECPCGIHRADCEYHRDPAPDWFHQDELHPVRGRAHEFPLGPSGGPSMPPVIIDGPPTHNEATCTYCRLEREGKLR